MTWQWCIFGVANSICLTVLIGMKIDYRYKLKDVKARFK